LFIRLLAVIALKINFWFKTSTSYNGLKHLLKDRGDDFSYDALFSSGLNQCNKSIDDEL